MAQPRIANPSFLPHSVRSDWMGCFTTDSGVCNELFQAGVPIWFMRYKFTITDKTIIEKPIRYMFPDHIIRSQYFEKGKTVRPFDLLHSGPGGFQCHFHSCRHYTGTKPESAVMPPTTSAAGLSHVGKAPSQAQLKKQARKQPPCRSKTGSWHVL